MARPRLILFALLALAGCRAPARRVPGVVRSQLADAATAEVDPAPPPPPDTGRPAKSILALSGGGSYGAFSAGVLTGWSRANTRPKFDVVTGISTGALLAPLAFLGPDYDPLMRQFYTEVGQTDIFTPLYWAEVPFNASIASAKPLRAILESGMTPEVVAAIVKEHEAGRRLYIATTQLDTRQAVVWDVGAVAGRPNGRELVIRIMLASSAVPGIFPPVALPRAGGRGHELHVDGGTAAPVFVPPFVLENAAPGAELSVVVAGKLCPESAPVPARLLKVLGASGVAVMSSQLRSSVANLYHAARLHGVKFGVASLRQDYAIEDSGIEFDTHNMGRLYVEGVKIGLAGTAFDPVPDDRGPGTDPADVRRK